LFARKVSTDVSAELLDRIDAERFDEGPALKRSNERP
jgi:hypothetical protein